METKDMLNLTSGSSGVFSGELPIQYNDINEAFLMHAESTQKFEEDILILEVTPEVVTLNFSRDDNIMATQRKQNQLSLLREINIRAAAAIELFWPFTFTGIV